MKTRAEIYGNEATDLLRIVTMYPGLCEHQLLCFHPGKEDTTKALLSHLERQGRIFQTDGGGYFLAGQTPKTDHALVRAVWVLLDFIRQVITTLRLIFPLNSCFLPTVNYMRLLILPPGRRHLSAMLCGATKGEAAVSCWSILRRKSPKSTVRAYPDFVL